MGNMNHFEGAQRWRVQNNESYGSCIIHVTLLWLSVTWPQEKEFANSHMAGFNWTPTSFEPILWNYSPLARHHLTSINCLSSFARGDFPPPPHLVSVEWYNVRSLEQAENTEVERAIATDWHQQFSRLARVSNHCSLANPVGHRARLKSNVNTFRWGF